MVEQRDICEPFFIPVDTHFSITDATKAFVLLRLQWAIALDQIKKIAKDVYRVLGSGFSEDVYDRAMQVGLRLGKFRYEGQKVVELNYKDHCVGDLYG